MDTRELLTTLKAAHPKTHISDATLTIYAADLADIEPDVLEQAITRLRRTLRFFPTIAEIREAAIAIAEPTPDPAEAFHQATSGRLGHPLVAEAHRLVGDAWHWRTATASDLHRQFTAAYQQVRERRVAELQAGVSP